MRFIKLKMKIISSILLFSVTLFPIVAYSLAYESTKEAEAFQRGDFDAVKRILKKNPRDYEDPVIIVQALHFAIGSENLALVKYLKSLGWLDVCRKAKGCSPIYIASSGKSIAMIKFFMAEGWSAKKLENGKTNALILAARYGYAKVVKYFLEQGIDKNIRDGFSKKRTAFEYAIDRPYFVTQERLADVAQIIEYLVGEDQQLMAKAFPTIVSHYPVGKIQYFERLGWLQACAKDMQCLPIHRAARNGHYGAVKYLIEKRFSVNSKDKWGQTPLHLISKTLSKKIILIRIPIARLLCETGVDQGIRNKFGKTALDYALKDITLKNIFDNKDKENARIKSLTELIKYLQSGQCKKK